MLLLYWISIYWISKKYRKNSRNTINIWGKEEKSDFRDLELVGEPDTRLSAYVTLSPTHKEVLSRFSTGRKKERKETRKKKMRAEIALTGVAHHANKSMSVHLFRNPSSSFHFRSILHFGYNDKCSLCVIAINKKK